MFQLNEADRKAIEARMILAMDLYLNEPTLKGALSKLYCHFLPDAAPQQGDLMAEHILLRIREYDMTRAELLAGAECPDLLAARIKEQLLGLMEETSLYDQCQKLSASLAGMEQLETSLETGVFLSHNRQFDPFYTGDVDEDTRNELLDQVVEKLLSPGAAETMAKLSRSAPLPDPYPELTQNMDQDAYRALMTVSTYTLLLSGAHRPKPGELSVSIDQVVLEVCRSTAFRSVTYGLTEETSSSLTPSQLYSADWSAVKVLLAAGILAGGVTVVLLTKSIMVAYVTYYTVMALFAGIAFFSDYLLDLLFQGKIVEDDDVHLDFSQAKADTAAYLMGTAAQALPEVRKESTAPTKETHKKEQTDPNHLW